MLFQYSLEKDNSTLHFGDITGTTDELNPRDFIGKINNCYLYGWGMRLETMRFR